MNTINQVRSGKTGITEHDALIVIDMQNDFLPGGALAIAGADRIIPCVNSACPETQYSQ